MVGDLRGINFSSVKQMMGNKKTKKIMQEVAKIRNDNYPELLGEYFVINAPLWFRGIWSIGKYMLDEKTRKKVKIYGTSGWQEDIKKVIDVD